MSRSFLRRQFHSFKLRAADVGAHGGVVDHWLPFLDWMKIEAFEPNAEDCRRQQEKSPAQVSWHAIGLAEKTGTFPLYWLNRSTGSSLYPPNVDVMARFSTEDYYGLKQIVNVPCMSLSDFYRQKSLEPVHILKMDTQGAELRILQGLVDSDWSSLLAIEVEVEFQEMYKGQPLFGDVDTYLRERGFELWDLRTHRSYQYRSDQPSQYIRDYLGFDRGNNRLSAQLVAGDALYFRRIENLKREHFPHVLLNALIYNAFDRFYRALELGTQKGWIQEIDVQSWRSLAKSTAPRPMPWQKSTFLRKVISKLNSIFGTNFLRQRVFWTWRSWPDQ